MRTEPLARHPNDGWILADPYPMRRSTWTAFRAIIRALCPPDPAPDADALGMAIRRTMRYMPRLTAFLFCVALHLLDWSPIWRLRSWRRLRSLPRERGAEILQQLGESRVPLLHMLVMGARGSVLCMYFDQDEVHRRLKYDPVPFLRGRVALRQRLLAEKHPTGTSPRSQAGGAP